MGILLGERLQGPEQANGAEEPADPVAGTADQDKRADDPVERAGEEAGNGCLEPVALERKAIRSRKDRVDHAQTDAADRDQTREAVQKPCLGQHAPILAYVRDSVEGGVTSPFGRLAPLFLGM